MHGPSPLVSALVMMYRVARLASVSDVMICLVMCAMLRMVQLVAGRLAELDRKN